MSGAGNCNCEPWVCLFTYICAVYWVNNTQTLLGFQSHTRQITRQFTLGKRMGKTKGTKVEETSKRDFMVLLCLTFLLCVCTVLRIMGLRSMIHAFGLIDIVNKPHIEKIQIFNRENCKKKIQLLKFHLLVHHAYVALIYPPLSTWIPIIRYLF